MSLPYATATSGNKSIAEMQRVLQRFGCSRFGVMEDWETEKLIIQFRWRNRDVVLEASWRGYAEAYLREYPYSDRMRRSRREHEERALEQAAISVYSVLRDWLRGQIVAVETGLLSFEAVFLPHMLLEDGRTVIAVAREKMLPALTVDAREGTR